MDISCPFCQTTMEERHVPAFAGLFRTFACPSCKSELKQPLAVEHQSAPSSRKNEGHQGCPECAFGDVHCCMCDDSLCENHVRTIEKYATYFSEELATDLTARFGGRIYCPLCFQSTIKSASADERTSQLPKPKVFNWPVILGLLSLFVIIMIGLGRCDSATTLKQVSAHERTAETGP